MDDTTVFFTEMDIDDLVSAANTTSSYSYAWYTHKCLQIDR